MPSSSQRPQSWQRTETVPGAQLDRPRLSGRRGDTPRLCIRDPVVGASRAWPLAPGRADTQEVSMHCTGRLRAASSSVAEPAASSAASRRDTRGYSVRPENKAGGPNNNAHSILDEPFGIGCVRCRGRLGLQVIVARRGLRNHMAIRVHEVLSTSGAAALWHIQPIDDPEAKQHIQLACDALGAALTRNVDALK